MNILDINKHRCKLKNLCFKTATKPYTERSIAFIFGLKNIEEIDIAFEGNLYKL